MDKKNYFIYQLSDTSYTSGYFAIYQSKNGAIMLAMGNDIIVLTIEQIQKLNIDLYSMDSFDIDDYKKYYNINLEEVEEIPAMEGTQEALDKIVI